MKLIIEDDEGRKTVVPVLRDEITIGRNDENIVRLAEKDVSRRHGRLLRHDGEYYIEDLSSVTGIRVNGEKIEGRRLIHAGDLIQISEYDLILMTGPEENASAPLIGLGSPEDETDRQEAADTDPPDPAGADAGAEVPGESKVAAEAQARRLAETATIRLSDLKREA